MTSPKDKRTRDWTYSEGCGCKVTFLGEYLCRESVAAFNPDCTLHADTAVGRAMRRLFCAMAKISLKKHAEELDVTHD